MTLEALRVLCAVIESRSFRSAAEQTHRSQPAVSQQIKSLEKQLGYPLIDRGTCAPTAAGKLVYERARKLLRDAESLRREIADLDEHIGRELRIGAGDTTALYFLPRIIRAFSKEQPQTRLVVTNRPTQGIISLLEQGGLDLGVITLPPTSGELECVELFQQKFVLVMHTSHRLSARRRIKLEQIKGEPLLMLDRATRTGEVLWSRLEERGLRPSPVLDSGSFEVIKRYVAENVGVSFLPSIAITPADKHLATAVVPELPTVTIGAAWRKGEYQSGAVRRFVSTALVQGQTANF